MIHGSRLRRDFSLRSGSLIASPGSSERVASSLVAPTNQFQHALLPRQSLESAVGAPTFTQRDAHIGTTSTIESSRMNWSAFTLSSTRARAARARNDSHCTLFRNIGE